MSSRSGWTMTRAARVAIALVLLASMLAVFAPTAGAAGGFDVKVNLQLCPDGFNGPAATFAEFSQTCATPVGGATFSVAVGAGTPSGQTDLDGNFELLDVPVSNATIYGFMPEQSWLTRAFCAIYPTGSPSGDYYETATGQSGRTYAMGGNTTLDCKWFAYTPTTADPVTIDITLHGCPLGWDGINANIYDFALSCQTPIGGSVIAAQFDSVTPSFQTDLDGRWTLGDIPPGQVTVSQFPVQDGQLIRAFCKQADGLTGEGTYYEEPVGQGSASWNLLSGQTLMCEWYNFTYVEQTTASVMVRLHKCPNGYKGSSVSIYDLAADCQGTPRNVNFTITPLFTNPTTTATDQTGWVTWQAVPSGKLTIKQQVPSGVTHMRVFCKQSAITGEETARVEIGEAPDGTLTDFLLAGYDSYDCDWFNISDFTAAGGASADGDELDEAEVIEADEDESAEVVEADEDDVANPETDDDATDDDVDNGDGDGGGNGSGGGDGNGSGGGASDNDAGSNGSINEGDDDLGESANGDDEGDGTEQADDEEGATGGGSTATSLTITLFTCPSGYDLFAEDADPAEDCDEVEEDVEFTSLGERSQITASKITDENGQAIYPKLGSGHHLITAYIPYSVDYAFILGCGSNLSDYASPLYPVAFTGPNGEISIDVQKGEQLACDWYNVPD